MVEAVGGWWSGSLALLSDAGHMLTDAFALGLAWFAHVLTHRPASRKLTYGLARAEVLAALANALLLLVLVGSIVIEAIGRFQQPQPVAALPALGVAVIGLMVNLLVARILSHGHSLNERAALLHVLGDILGSVAAIASAVVIYYTGWTLIDPLLSVLIALLIVRSTWSLLHQSISILLEATPPQLDVAVVQAELMHTSGVEAVNDLHVWSVSSGKIALTAHVDISSMAQWPHILQQLQQRLHDRFGIDHITLQPEIASQRSAHAARSRCAAPLP